MPLISLEFALFFIVFFVVYWLLRMHPRIQNLLLLVASLGWLLHISTAFVVAVVVFALMVHWCGRQIIHAAEPSKRGWLAIGIVVAVANLALYKYCDFFVPVLKTWLQTDVLDIIMPLGLSYYTFQGVAYLVGLYQGKTEHLKFFNLLLHFSFFPTITSGPIIRAGSFQSIGGCNIGAATQLQTSQPRHIIRPALAVSLILLGILKKWWLAGFLGENWVDPVFDNPLQYDGVSLLTAIYGYTAQLFFDFSGYSDLVIGMAMLLGFKLPANFMMPLTAINIRDFWARWHITLSTWIRDYIYIPLGGSRKGFVRQQINVMAAMVLSGIWHGYGWNFMLWGALHGTALVLLNVKHRLWPVTASPRPQSIILSQWLTLTFVCAAFVVFHTASLAAAGSVFQSLLQGSNWVMPINVGALSMLLLLGVCWFFYPCWVSGFQGFVGLLEKIPMWAWPIPVGAILLVIYFMAPAGIPGFIYANF